MGFQLLMLNVKQYIAGMTENVIRIEAQLCLGKVKKEVKMGTRTEHK